MSLSQRKTERERFVSDSLYGIATTCVVVSLGEDFAEFFWGFPSGSTLELTEGTFVFLCLASFFLFEAAYWIAKKEGFDRFVLSCTALLTAALVGNDIFADLYLEYVNPYLAPLATNPLYDRTEWVLGGMGGVALLINILVFYKRKPT